MSPEQDAIGFLRTMEPTDRGAGQWSVERCAPPASLAAIGAARDFTSVFCRARGIAHVAQAAQTVITELVTNAVTHAGGALDLWCARGHDRLYVAVRDADRRMPHIGRHDGLGLLLVDALSSRWGSQPSTPGKIVWAIIHVP